MKILNSLLLIGLLLNSCTTIIIQAPENNQEETTPQDPEKPNPEEPNPEEPNPEKPDPEEPQTYDYVLQANFDYDLSNEENAKFFQDSLYTLPLVLDEKSLPGFVWSDLAFNYKKNEMNEILGGCRISFSCDSTSFDKIDENTVVGKLHSVYSKKGIYSLGEDINKKPIPNGFLVFYANPQEEEMPEHDIVFYNTKNGTCIMNACVVNNTAAVVKAVKTTFKKGDYIKLTATGIRDGAETGKAEIFLAEYNEEKNFIMKDWTKFDLASLGDIDSIDFTWDTNKTEIPPYFCLDLLTAAVALSY